MRYHCRYYDAPVADVLVGKIDLDDVRKDCGIVTVEHDEKEGANFFDEQALPGDDTRSILERFNNRGHRRAAMKASESFDGDDVFCGLVEPEQKYDVVVEVAPVGGPYEPTVLVANCYKVVFDADGKKFVVDPTAYKRFVVEKTVVVRRVARAV